MRCDVAVIGAGPAGLPGAAEAARGGSVVLIDLAQRTGGQYYRHRHGSLAEPGFRAHQSLCDTRGVRTLTGRQVHLVEPGPPFTIHTGQERIVADRLLIATGAHDRVVPFPGWDLAGVMTAGGAQSLLKGYGVLPGKRIVVAGTGPFLLPVAVGFVRAGARVAVFDANRLRDFARHPAALAANPGKIGEAARYLAILARHRVPVRGGTPITRALGADGRLDAVVLGDTTLRCDILAVGHGFTPQIDIGVTLGCATRVTRDGTLALTVDADQQTSVPGVYAAGEVTGIGGHDKAEAEGLIAGRALSGVDDASTAKVLRDLARHRAFADAVADVYPVPAPDVDDDTVICRCEEVTRATIAAAVTGLGARDTRAVKLLTRAGMGWCQGRMCGGAVDCLVAGITGTPAAPMPARRILTQPVRLGDLARDEKEERA